LSLVINTFYPGTERSVNDKNAGTFGFPCFKIFMGDRRVGEGIGLTDIHLDGAVLNDLEKILGVGQKIIPCGRVGH